MKSQKATAYERIKDMIFKMELLPGSPIPELQIAAKLSIGRTPIHDALCRLVSEGLVIIGSNRRAAVVCFNDEEISQIGAVRLAQDILSAQLASYYGSAADFDKLEQFAADCEEASTKGDVYGRIRIDADFHLAIAKISGNDRLIALQYATYQQIHLIQVAKYTDIEHSLIQIHHHMPLVSAIRNGELGEARNLICEHIKDFYRIDPYILKCYCDN